MRARCAPRTPAFGIARNRIAALACFVNHARWRLNLGKKKKGGRERTKGKNWTRVGEKWREKKGERERERERWGGGRRHKRHECESLLALLLAQEAHRELCTGLYMHRAFFVYRISSFLSFFASTPSAFLLK